MYTVALDSLQFLNQLLTAGIAITAFSLLLYALTFNLHDRVARSFAIILACVVIVFVGDAISSIASNSGMLEFWLRLEWVGIVYLPAVYLHFSDAILATTGRPSRGRRRIGIRLSYLFSTLFLLTLPFPWLVGELVPSASPAPHLQRTWLTWIFALYYTILMVLSWVNFWRAHQRCVTSTSRRRMRYLLAGAVAPALGSYPFLLFGSGIAATHPLWFWLTAFLTNLLVTLLLVVMAYSVAFFGVSWPDRVVKRRLFKWLMRGPVTASTVLAATTLTRRLGENFGTHYSAVVPVVMVGAILVMEYAITLAAPVWERWLFHGGDAVNMRLLQALDERQLTSGDLRQFLESILAAVCDRLQAPKAFIVGLDSEDLEMFVSVGDQEDLTPELSNDLVQLVKHPGTNGQGKKDVFLWQDYMLIPLYSQYERERTMIGLLGAGIGTQNDTFLYNEQMEALQLLASRAALALGDRRSQQQIFSSIQMLNPQIEMIQRLRAAAQYDQTGVLTTPDAPLEPDKLSRWVKDALTHYWGGPKLTESPLIRLTIVQQALQEHQDTPSNALRAILRQAIDQIRPEGERRFTGEWILYNILEMKFMEGHKVREIAMRLAMSEADLYRKQRVAVEAVANAIVEMEQKAREENGNGKRINHQEELPNLAS
jgi:hypothetical protein